MEIRIKVVGDKVLIWLGHDGADFKGVVPDCFEIVPQTEANYSGVLWRKLDCKDCLECPLELENTYPSKGN